MGYKADKRSTRQLQGVQDIYEGYKMGTKGTRQVLGYETGMRWVQGI